MILHWKDMQISTDWESNTKLIKDGNWEVLFVLRIAEEMIIYPPQRSPTGKDTLLIHMPIFPWQVADQPSKTGCQISQTKKLNYEYYIRYRLGLQYRLKKNIYTTVLNEVYLEFPDLELPLNKTSLNVELRITKVFGVELFYTIESNLKRESPWFTYIIGCKLEISPFKR